MAYKILTKNGIDNSNIDGARGEYFNSGMRNGIVQGVLNEGTFIASSSNVISFDTCELRIAGHRIVIDEPVYHTFSNAPRTDTRYAFIAQIIVGSDQSVEFSLFVQTANTSLIQNELYKTISGAGTYQVEIGRFTLTQSLLIEDVVKTIDVITGGTGGNSGDYIKIGQVTTTTTASGTMANVDIENVERQGEMQTDFHFDIPAPIGTTVVVAGEEQESVSFKSDPQTQINNVVQEIENITDNISTLQDDIEELGNELNTTNSNLTTETENLQTQINNIWSKIYPVGAIYISINSTSPASIFGGTWESIQGRFLLASGNGYTTGETGGEATHTLTINEMPSHTHTMSAGITNSTNHEHSAVNGTNVIAMCPTLAQRDYNPLSNANGGNQSHNNMPPYLVVNIWKRIA